MQLLSARQGANARSGNMQATRRAAVRAHTALRDLRHPLPKLRAVNGETWSRHIRVSG